MEKTYDLVISIVNRGYSDVVVEASRRAGSTGGTIIYGRGTSAQNEKDSFMGISIEPEKEIIMTLTPIENRNQIMESVCTSAEMEKEGVGICFSLPVSNVRGITPKKQIDYNAESGESKN